MSSSRPDLPASHEYVDLSRGACHYRIDGPPGRPTVLLIHGATVPAWEFDRLVPLLLDAGLRTVRADLYGHGYSARPRVAYDHALFVEQQLELLDALEQHAPVHVLGHSLGAAIGARLLDAAPHRFASLVLAAPLVDFTANVPNARLLDVPLLGECLMPAYVMPMLVRRRTRRYRAIEDGRFVDLYRAQLRVPGFGRALLSLFRAGSLGDQRDCYAALRRHPHPLLILHAAADTIVPAAQIGDLRALVPAARYHAVEGAGHAFILTDPEKVAPPVIEFLHALVQPAQRAAR